MNVGVFIGNYSPEVGGGYTFQQEICRAIEIYGPASGHKFVFFTFSQVVPSEGSTNRAIRFISISGDNKSRLSNFCNGPVNYFVQAILRLFGFKIHDRTADIILSRIRDESIDITWSLTPACLSTEVPFITTVWDLEHRMQPYFPEVSLNDEWNAREKQYTGLLGKAAYVITGTQAGKLEIEKLYNVPSDRIRVLPFPTPHFVMQDDYWNDSNLLQKYGLPDKYLLYPAQFWPHKNHYGLLISLQVLQKKYNLTIPVVFVGSDMGNLDYIRKVVVDLGLSEQVHFLGFVPRDHLIMLYRNAFALLYLTFFGPDNLPPLEAFALSCPVIASNVSGAQEQLGDAALLVDPKDPDNVAEAINMLHKDTSFRQTLVSRGLIQAAGWTGENYFNGICSIFDEFENIRRTWSNSEPFKLVR